MLIFHRNDPLREGDFYIGFAEGFEDFDPQSRGAGKPSVRGQPDPAIEIHRAIAKIHNENFGWGGGLNNPICRCGEDVQHDALGVP
jgi:hypothetical protein